MRNIHGHFLVFFFFGFFFFSVGWDSNPGPCIYYALSLPIEVNSQGQRIYYLICLFRWQENISLVNYYSCHTPIFDLTCHWHVSLGPTFVRSLTWSISNVFDEIPAERYFKIPHVWFRVRPSSLFIFIFFFILIPSFI